VPTLWTTLRAGAKVVAAGEALVEAQTAGATAVFPDAQQQRCAAGSEKQQQKPIGDVAAVETIAIVGAVADAARPS